MALTNDILSAPTITGPYDETTRLFSNGTNAFHSAWHITTADLAGLGAFTTGDILLESLPAGLILTYCRIMLTEVLDSTSDVISVATARVTFNGTDMGSGTLNLLGTVNSVINDITGLAGSAVAANPLKVHIALTGGNASVITAGKATVWREFIVLA